MTERIPESGLRFTKGMFFKLFYICFECFDRFDRFNRFECFDRFDCSDHFDRFNRFDQFFIQCSTFDNEKVRSKEHRAEIPSE